MADPPAEGMEGGTAELDATVASSLPTMPMAKKSPHTNSGRLNVRKSNNMLHDLQDYIRGVEAVAAARKDQLERIYQEQRDRERKERMAKDHCRSHENDFLNFGNQVNTPTKIRTLTEEVKAQKDKVKKFKEKANIAERAVVAQQTQILKLEDKCAQISDALASTGKSMKQLLDEAALREALEEKEKVVADLENRVRILTRAREMDAKMVKAEQRKERKMAEKLSAQVAALQAEVVEKEKETRASKLELKSMAKELEAALKAAARLPPSSPVESTPFLTEAPVGEEELEPQVLYDDRHIHLMMCVIRDDGRVAGKKIVTLEEKEEQAAVKIQASFRGHKARLQVKEKAAAEAEAAAAAAEAATPEPGAMTEEMAAVKIQAVSRGHLARKQMAAKKEEEEAAVVGPEPPAEESKEAVPAKGEKGKKGTVTAATKNRVGGKAMTPNTPGTPSRAGSKKAAFSPAAATRKPR